MMKRGLRPWTSPSFPYSGVESLDADYCRRVGQYLAQLLAFAIRDGRVDPRSNLIADLHGVMRQWDLSTGRETRRLDCSVLYRYDPTFMAGHAKSIIFPPSATLSELVVAAFGRDRPELAYKLYVLVSVVAIPWLIAS